MIAIRMDLYRLFFNNHNIVWEYVRKETLQQESRMGNVKKYSPDYRIGHENSKGVLPTITPYSEVFVRKHSIYSYGFSKENPIDLEKETQE